MLSNKPQANAMINKTKSASKKHLLIATLCLAVAPLAAQPRTVRIGMIIDGPLRRGEQIVPLFRSEITTLLAGEFDAEFPESKTVVCDLTAPGVRQALDRQLADPQVDLILLLGGIASHEVAKRGPLPKPVIAVFVSDPELQGLPQKEGASGVKNLNYLNEAYSVTHTIKLFQGIVHFKKLAVLMNPALLVAIPELEERAKQEVAGLGAELEFIPVTTSAAAALQALPADVDAVYVTPLLQISRAEFEDLVAGINQRRLPSFSYLGRSEVDAGLLASYAPEDDLLRRARRVAISMQRILKGENAGDIPVDFASAPQLTINMATARAIGFYPNWRTLTEAELIHQEKTEAGRTLSLAASVKEAVRVNLDLLAAHKQVESGKQEVNKARASLLPQLDAAATGTVIKKETAEGSFGQQAQRQMEGSLTLSQVIYSEPAWANYSIEKHLQKGREDERRRVELDIAEQAATTYLDVLRAQALARIQRANLRLSVSNLDLARLRESAGASGRSDVYRWESEVATSRKNVIEADAQVEVADLAMNRILNRPLEEPFTTTETAIDDSSLLTGEQRLFGYFDNAQTFGVFRDFMVQEGLSAAPELRQLEAALAAQERAKSASSRAFWMPTVALQAGLTNVFYRGGAGSTGAQLPSSLPISLPEQQDLFWNAGVQVSLPLITGLSRIAQNEQAAVEIDRLQLEAQSLELAISQRIRSAMHVAGASYAGIEQARVAAEAARKNLELVTEAYSSGAVAIVTLLDAQNAALVAYEAATNAVYGFLIDLMRVERAVGQFYFLRTAQEKQAYFNRLQEFYRKAGVRL